MTDEEMEIQFQRTQLVRELDTIKHNIIEHAKGQHRLVTDMRVVEQKLSVLRQKCKHSRGKVTEGCGAYQNADRHECPDCGLNELRD